MTFTARTPTTSENASAITITATLPTDRVAGDLNIVAFSLPGTPAQFTGPGAGWTTLITPTDNGSGETLAAYYAFSPASAPAASTSASASRCSGVMQAWGGVPSASPLDVVASGNVGSLVTSVNAPSITTVTDGALFVSIAQGDTSALTRSWVTPSGMTLVIQTASGGRSIGIAQEARATHGATGTRSWAYSPSASLNMQAWSFALKPGNVLNLTGSVTATGVLAKATSKKFTGSITPGAGVLVILKTVPKLFTGSVTAAGTLVKKINKAIFTASITPGPGVLGKVIPKAFTASITPGPGTFRKAFPRIFTGSITPAGNVVLTLLGRVFGRPGRAVVKAYKAAEVVIRIRRS